jgi:chemotaxis protein histidine kinase CheA
MRGSSEHVQMERSHKLLEFMNTLINTTKDNIVILNKTTLQLVLNCLQVTQAKVRLPQEKSHLLNDELIELKSQKLVKFSELVFVQNNPLYNDDNDDQQSVKEQINKPPSKEASDENESQEEDAKAYSDTTSISESKCEAHHQVQNDLSKRIIKPWEELQFNRN